MKKKTTFYGGEINPMANKKIKLKAVLFVLVFEILIIITMGAAIGYRYFCDSYLDTPRIKEQIENLKEDLISNPATGGGKIMVLDNDGIESYIMESRTYNKNNFGTSYNSDQ